MNMQFKKIHEFKKESLKSMEKDLRVVIDNSESIEVAFSDMTWNLGPNSIDPRVSMNVFVHDFYGYVDVTYATLDQVEDILNSIKNRIEDAGNIGDELFDVFLQHSEKMYSIAKERKSPNERCLFYGECYDEIDFGEE